MCLILT